MESEGGAGWCDCSDGAIDFDGIIGYHGPVGSEARYGAVGFACLAESVGAAGGHS